MTSISRAARIKTTSLSKRCFICDQASEFAFRGWPICRACVQRIAALFEKWAA